MRKPIFVRALSPAEREAVQKGLRSSDAFTLRRCQIILASEKGQKPIEIADHLGCTDQAVRNAIHAFNAQGVKALTAGSTRPHHIERGFDDAAMEQLREMLHQSPRKYGKATSVWTLELAADVAFEQGLTGSRVAGETVRATLKRMGISWRRAKHWITSPDPAYLRKKNDATG
jgi:transposase